MTGEEMQKISEAKQAWKRLSKKDQKGVKAIQSMIAKDLDAFFNRRTTAAVGKPMQGLSNLRPSVDSKSSIPCNVQHTQKGGKLTMPQSLPQHIAWLERQRRLLKAIADHAPFSIRKDLTISALLSLALESLPECPQTTKQAWLNDAVDSCLRGIQRTVMKEVSQPDAIEVPRRLPVPISLADGHYPGPSDASENGCVYGGVTLCRDPSRWHWRFAHYTLLESGGFTHWLPPDVECLPARVEP